MWVEFETDTQLGSSSVRCSGRKKKSILFRITFIVSDDEQSTSMPLANKDDGIHKQYATDLYDATLDKTSPKFKFVKYTL